VSGTGVVSVVSGVASMTQIAGVSAMPMARVSTMPMAGVTVGARVPVVPEAKQGHYHEAGHTEGKAERVGAHIPKRKILRR
jgi:hypothetical protein